MAITIGAMVACTARIATRLATFTRRFRDAHWRRGDRRLIAEPCQHTGKPTALRRWRSGSHHRRDCWHRHRRRLCGRNALDEGFLPRFLRLVLHLLGSIGFLRLRNEIERRGQWLALIEVLVPQALDRVIGRFQMAVRDEQHVDLKPRFDRQHFGALFVEQERCDVDGNLRDDLCGGLFHRFFLQDAQDMQRRGFGTANVADAVAARTRDVRRFGERRAQPLAGQFHQSETGNLAELYTGAVVAQCFL